MINFGLKLKALRESQGLTQKQLAEMLDLEPATVSGYERSAVYPSVEKLVEICEHFRVSADYMLGLHGEQSLQLKTLTDDQNMAVTEIVRLFALANQQHQPE